jgi:hypothetical protein
MRPSAKRNKSNAQLLMWLACPFELNKYATNSSRFVGSSISKNARPSSIVGIRPTLTKKARRKNVASSVTFGTGSFC